MFIDKCSNTISAYIPWKGCRNCNKQKPISGGIAYPEMIGLAFPGAGYPFEGGTYAGAYGIGLDNPLYGMAVGGKGLEKGKGDAKGLDVSQKGGIVSTAVPLLDVPPTLLGYPGNQGVFVAGVGATQGLGSLHNPVLVGNQYQYGPLSGSEVFGMDPFYGPFAGFGLGSWGYRGPPSYDFINSATSVYGYPDVLENVPINVLQQQVNPIALTNGQYVAEIYPQYAPFGGYGWTAFN